MVGEKIRILFLFESPWGFNRKVKRGLDTLGSGQR